MLYERTQGPVEEAIIRQCIRNNLPYPDKIANAPALREFDIFYFNAYQELCTCRPYEGGFIPWTALRDYGVYCGHDEEQFEDLKNIVYTLDNEMRAEAKAKDKGGDHIGR